MKRVFSAMFFAFMLHSRAFADTLSISNGDRISGVLMFFEAGAFTIEAVHGRYRIPLDQLERIDMQEGNQYRLFLLDGTNRLVTIVFIHAGEIEFQRGEARGRIALSLIRAIRRVR